MAFPLIQLSRIALQGGVETGPADAVEYEVHGGVVAVSDGRFGELVGRQSGIECLAGDRRVTCSFDVGLGPPHEFISFVGRGAT